MSDLLCGGDVDACGSVSLTHQVQLWQFAGSFALGLYPYQAGQPILELKRIAECAERGGSPGAEHRWHDGSPNILWSGAYSVEAALVVVSVRVKRHHDSARYKKAGRG